MSQKNKKLSNLTTFYCVVYAYCKDICSLYYSLHCCKHIWAWSAILICSWKTHPQNRIWYKYEYEYECNNDMIWIWYPLYAPNFTFFCIYFHFLFSRLIVTVVVLLLLLLNVVFPNFSTTKSFLVFFLFRITITINFSFLLRIILKNIFKAAFLFFQFTCDEMLLIYC